MTGHYSRANIFAIDSPTICRRPQFHPKVKATVHSSKKLIVVVAFDRDEDGELQAVFGPAEQQSGERAIRTARALAPKHAGVIAWSREANSGAGRIRRTADAIPGRRSAGYGVT